MDAKKIFKKIKGKLKRHEIQEQLLYLTMQQNAISKKDYVSLLFEGKIYQEHKMKLIADNKHLFEELYDRDDALKERLGIVQHLK